MPRTNAEKLRLASKLVTLVADWPVPWGALLEIMPVPLCPNRQASAEEQIVKLELPTLRGLLKALAILRDWMRREQGPECLQVEHLYVEVF